MVCAEKPPPTQQAMKDDAFVLEATRRFQRGELSGEALQAVLICMKPKNTCTSCISLTHANPRNPTLSVFCCVECRFRDHIETEPDI